MILSISNEYIIYPVTCRLRLFFSRSDFKTSRPGNDDELWWTFAESFEHFVVSKAKIFRQTFSWNPKRSKQARNTWNKGAQDKDTTGFEFLDFDYFEFVWENIQLDVDVVSRPRTDTSVSPNSIWHLGNENIIKKLYSTRRWGEQNEVATHNSRVWETLPTNCIVAKLPIWNKTCKCCWLWAQKIITISSTVFVFWQKT